MACFNLIVICPQFEISFLQSSGLINIYTATKHSGESPRTSSTWVLDGLCCCCWCRCSGGLPSAVVLVVFD